MKEKGNIDILDEINKKRAQKRKIQYVIFSVIALLVCLILGIRIGSAKEMKSNLEKDEEILMNEIYRDVSNLSYFMDNNDLQTTETSEIQKYNSNYVQLLVMAENLKATLEIGDEFLYSDGNGVALYKFADAIDLSFSMIEGVTLEGELISKDFFEDGKLEQEERDYLTTLAHEYKEIYDQMKIKNEEQESIIDIDEFVTVVQPFVDKYQIGDELYELKLEN